MAKKDKSGISDAGTFSVDKEKFEKGQKWSKEAGPGNFEPLPVGVYPARIFEATHTKSESEKTSGSRKYTIKAEITEGEYKGRKVVEFPIAHRNTFPDYARLLRLAGIDVDALDPSNIPVIDSADVLGVDIEIHVTGHKPRYNPMDKPELRDQKEEIKSFLPAEGGAKKAKKVKKGAR